MSGSIGSIGRGSNVFDDTLQAYVSRVKEISGPVVIFKNNGHDGSLSGKSRFECAVPMNDVAIIEELARQIRIQNNLPTYDELMATETESKEFSGRVAEVWKEIEADPTLIETIMQVSSYSVNGQVTLPIELNTNAVKRLVQDFCVLITINEDAIVVIGGGNGAAVVEAVSPNPADYRVSPGLGTAIVNKIREAEQARSKDAEED